jgi:hypothetical protein
MSMSMSMSNRHSRIVLVLSSVALLLTVWAQPAPVLAAPWVTSAGLALQELRRPVPM